MKPALTVDPQITDILYHNNRLSLLKLCKFLDLSTAQMAQIVERNQRTVQRDVASNEVSENLKPLIYALKLLYQMTGEDQVMIQRWIREPLTELKGHSPLDLLLKQRINAFKRMVERIREGDSAGY